MEQHFPSAKRQHPLKGSNAEPIGCSRLQRWSLHCFSVQQCNRIFAQGRSTAFPPRSRQSTYLESASAPMTTTFLYIPVRMNCAPETRPTTNPLQAAVRSKHRAFFAPISACTWTSASNLGYLQSAKLPTVLLEHALSLDCKLLRACMAWLHFLETSDCPKTTSALRIELSPRMRCRTGHLGWRWLG